jgi:hypothetical protein
MTFEPKTTHFSYIATARLYSLQENASRDLGILLGSRNVDGAGRAARELFEITRELDRRAVAAATAA